MSPRLAFALDAVHRAGRATLPYFQTGTATEMKADATPVTVADRTAERIVREAIAKAYPGESILGEEEGGAFDAADRWVLDPIDGTKSFVAGVPLYATLLSYEVDQVPVVGACYFPALDEMLYAEAGAGAFFNGRPCRVSTKTDLAQTTICVAGHRGLDKRGLTDGFVRIARQVMATRSWCDAYGHALVATGRVEAMVEPAVSRWDVSPIELIVREACGRYTSLAGKPGIHDDALSSNGLLHDWILETLGGEPR
ncbi:MAG: hypothetical protein KIS66_15635 [Fimbriimonadaceae bacterium]|nr:hypothetical protein [Fimbriimonadaceae bacterium]